MESLVEKKWNECLRIIEARLRNDGKYNDFKDYFKPIVPVHLEGHTLTIRVPSTYYYEFLEQHYIEHLSQALRATLGAKARLEYQVLMTKGVDGGADYTIPLQWMPTSLSNMGKQTINVPASNIANMHEVNPNAIPGIQRKEVKSNLKPHLSFSNFVVGNCNQLAYSLAKNVTEMDQKPRDFQQHLTLWGPSGVGKTHLLHAIGLEIKEKYPDRVVKYVAAMEFMSEYQFAAQNRKIRAFKEEYTSLDVLLIDDIHLLGGRHGTQQVFQEIYDHFSRIDLCLVLSMNCQPKSLTDFQPEILTRLRWGISGPLYRPEYETRLAILRSKSQQDGIMVIPDAVIEYIAANVNYSVRELEGVLNSLLATSVSAKVPITIDLAQRIVTSIVDNLNRKETSVEQIVKTVCDYYSVSVDRMQAQSRKREVATTRHMICYLIREMFPTMSLSAIGQYVGGRRHSTVHSSCNKIEDLLATDPQIKEDIQRIKSALQG